MAYFPNGSTGIRWQEENCFNDCIFWDDAGEKFICPVWACHQIFMYDESTKEILNMLIPMNKDGIFAEKCKMYRCTSGIPDVPGQMKLFEQE